MIKTLLEKKKRKQEYMKKYLGSHPWSKHKALISSRCACHPSYNGQKRLIRNLISTGEIRELWFRDKAYNMERPSIDRINSTGDYIYENCRFLELIENQKRPQPHSNRYVGMYTKGNWSKYHKKCIKCGCVDKRHEARGLCTTCYSNILYHKKPNETMEAIALSMDKILKRKGR